MSCEMQGVPPGLKVVKIAVAKKGERYIVPTSGSVVLSSYGTATRVAIVEKDNIYDVWALETVGIPNGHVRDGACVSEYYRVPKIGEMAIGMRGVPYRVGVGNVRPDAKRIIVRPVTKTADVPKVKKAFFKLVLSVVAPLSVDIAGNPEARSNDEGMCLELIRQISVGNFNIAKCAVEDEDEDIVDEEDDDLDDRSPA